ncbi:Carboxypeptidase Y inhibitor [Lachnellula arida]|uniref:Carboxypeptidase Y inhibitor n=1 Tax=Lachnellula arida TaxID=1316785 RepID=A0A8T9BCR9_9HELO|nr:Carboxypeptidase Y inhibitor [Lachnellula arida]
MPTNAIVKRILDVAEKDESKVLGVIVNGKAITTKQYIPRAEAQSAPEISYAVPNPSATYLVVALDLDAPFPSFGVLGPILHWIQPGFKAGPENTLTSSEPFVANYIGPAPPPGSAPHRYTFFLFEQPEGFDGTKYAPADGKPLGNLKRMRYDLDSWKKEVKLGEPLAVNYFLSN